MKKIASRIILTLFLLSIPVLTPSIQAGRAVPSEHVFNYPDALLPPDRVGNSFEAFSIRQSNPSYYETSEYLIGTVAVGIVFLESNGSIDPSTEDWTSMRESLVVSQISDSGLSWLANYNPDANVSFVYDVHYRVPTSYEPINNPSSNQEYWISEAMAYLGYPGTSYFTQVRDYVNDLRNTLSTDWAFAIFVVDSFYDQDGKFTDYLFAYAYLGGPFLVVTYDNGGWGITNMDRVTAHETCHIFYATDEYDGITEYSGYLNIADNEGSNDLMDNWMTWQLCQATMEQLGWRDSDEDRIHDILDTFPDTVLNPHTSDPTNETVLTYNGSAYVIPYPNNNPYGTGRDVTINTVAGVEFRVDGGVWQSATPSDSAFDEPEEAFSFTTPSLYAGTHVIEARGINSASNFEVSYSSDEVTVIVPAPANTLTITATAGGSTNPTPRAYVYASGSNVSVAAFPDANYTLTRWELNGSDVGSANPYWVFMNADYSLHAIFAPKGHDVAVTNITLSKTVTGQGNSANVNVTVENQGVFTETFNVTLYGNATLIVALIDISLSNESSTTITFSWNTGGFTYGNYVISAYASPVLNETDTTDNYYVDGLVLVTISGDVDGDRDVDIYDIVTMALAYGSDRGDLAYNPNCDLDSDGDVDIFDIVAAVGNYKRSW